MKDVMSLIRKFNREHRGTCYMYLENDSEEGNYHVRCRYIKSWQLYGWKPFESVSEFRDFLLETDW